jgi:hypothetical protein
MKGGINKMINVVRTLGLTTLMGVSTLVSACSKPNDNNISVPVSENNIINMKIGSYRGHRTEIYSDEEGEKINLYYVNFSPDTRYGLISAVDTNKDGVFDIITETNLLPNDSLKEFYSVDMLGKARSHVMTNGFWSAKRQYK